MIVRVFVKKRCECESIVFGKKDAIISEHHISHKKLPETTFRMTKLLRLLFSVHLIFPEIVVGWIQVGQSELNIRIKTKLLAQEVDEDSIDSYRSHLESSYAETNDALSDLDSKLRFNGRLEEVREVPYNRFNNLSTNPISDWSEYSACRGEECEVRMPFI